MTIQNNLTDIARIGLVKKIGTEWSEYTKTVTLGETADFAGLRIESTGVCGIYINGAFVKSNCGRYPGRIAYLEITPFLKQGENEIKFILGNHYYQETYKKIIQSNGTKFSCVAAEINIVCGRSKLRLTTDETWSCYSDDGQNKPCVFSEITKAEYERFWLNSALWQTQKPLSVPKEILDVAGDGYKDLLCDFPKEYKSFENIIECTFTNNSGTFECGNDGGYVLYDLGKLYVGFLELEYEVEKDTEINLEFDYTETLLDFTPKGTQIMRRLEISENLEKNGNKLFLLRRRAFRYLKISTSSDARFTIKSLKLLLDMMPYDKLGYFNCEDEKMNKIWSVGKYTLHVNKKLEYESCPRNERKFFSGDGIIEALADYYLFGDTKLTKSSMAMLENETDGGIRYYKLQKNIALTDYPAWRIITAYNYYFFYKDKEFIKEYFDDLSNCLEWMIEKVNSKGLIFQPPIFCFGSHASDIGAVMYNSSPDMYGTNPLFNALLYKSLLCMSELALIVGDLRSDYWASLAKDTKEACNNILWNDEMKVFTDDFYKNIVFQDGNAIAVLYGLATQDKTQIILDTIKKENHTPYGSTIINTDYPLIRGSERVISPLMCTYEAEARFLNGDKDGAVDLIRRCWGAMIDKKAETFWEFSPNNDYERWLIPAHGWSAGCTYLLGAYVLGIRPKTAGFETVTFEPYDGFERFNGVVPIKDKLAAVKCETENGIKKYTLAVPKGTVLDIHLPEKAVLELIEY